MPTLAGLMLAAAVADDALPVRHCDSDGRAVENVDPMGAAVEGRATFGCRWLPPATSASGLVSVSGVRCRRKGPIKEC